MLAKIFSIFTALFVAIVSLFNTMPDVEPMKIQPDDNFVPVLRFVVSSDSHIKKYGDIGCQRIMKMIKTGYAAAEADKNYSNLDAVVMVGDITNFGLPSAFWAVQASLDNSLKDGTDFLGIAAKNHDGYLGRISRTHVAAISGDRSDFHKVINGYHFIGISAAMNIFVHYSNHQLKWLDKELAKAVADDPTKPVFVFQHEHIKNTVYGSYDEDGWGVDNFTEILSKYPQVVDISGHSHYPANDPRAIWQGAFTAINDGGLAYYEFTVDGHNSQHPESSDNMAHMLLVEVDAQNRVKVRICDLNAEAVLGEYLIDDFDNPNKAKYSQEIRRANAEAPVFNSKPVVSVNGSEVTVTSKPAVPDDDDVVFIYRFEITDANGNVISSQKKLGDYYKHAVCENVTFKADNLESGEYTVKLVAESAWGKTSKPVTAKFAIS